MNGIEQAIAMDKAVDDKCKPFKNRVLEWTKANKDFFEIMAETGLDIQHIMHIYCELEREGLVKISGRPGTPMKIKVV